MDALRVPPGEAAELPLIDPKSIVWTMGIAPEWVGIEEQYFAWSIDAGDINGANLVFRDDGAGSAGAITAAMNAPDLTVGRFYDTVMVQLFGTGTVTPLRISLAIQIPTAAGFSTFAQGRISCANPGTAGGSGVGSFQSVYVPPRGVLQVNNIDQGGAGDTMTVACCGVNARAEGPVPMLPPMTVQTGI